MSSPAVGTDRTRVGRVAASVALTAMLLGVVGTAGGTTVDVQARDASATPLAEVVVVLDPLDGPAPRGNARVEIDQVAKRFVPRVTVLQSGSVVNFPNSDNVRHQVYSFSPAKTFSLKLYAGTEAPPVTFDRPGLVVLGCNIHDTMIAFVAVVDTPWFARTGADGRARIEAPPGRYRLRVWHPELEAAVPPREITLSGATTPLPLALQLGPSAGAVAGFPE